jgi:hypothetical protein
MFGKMQCKESFKQVTDMGLLKLQKTIDKHKKFQHNLEKAKLSLYKQMIDFNVNFQDK